LPRLAGLVLCHDQSNSRVALGERRDDRHHRDADRGGEAGDPQRAGRFGGRIEVGSGGFERGEDRRRARRAGVRPG
jgi:hypothetical protein